MTTSLRAGLPGFLTTALALVWLVARDTAGSPALALFLFGGAAFGVLGLVGLDLLAAAAPLPGAPAGRLRRLAAATICAPLVLLVVRVLGEPAAAAMPELVPLGLVVAALAALVVVRLGPRLGAPESPRFWLGAAVAGVQLSVLFVYLHLVEDTLAVVREGTERMHEALFFGTWIASLALLLPWAGRIAGRAGLAPSSRGWRVWGGLAVLVGLAALEVDRRELVGLYPGLHLWLQLVGVLSLDAGLSLCAPASAPARRLLARAGAVALALLLLGATSFAVWARVVGVDDRAFRSQVAQSAIGAPLLRIAGRPQQHALHADVVLRYELFHDVPPPPNDWNVILISVDALRGAAIPDPDDPDKRAAPRLAALAETCVDFRRAYSPGSRTAIGMGALMLGRYSAHIEWEMWMWARKAVDPEQSKADHHTLAKDLKYTTLPKIPPEGNLAQRLKAAGLVTLATPWDSYSRFFRKGTGFETGFDDYTDVEPFKWREPASAKVLELALAQQQRAKGRRFFQWIHLFDPHESRGKPEAYAELVAAMDGAIGDFLDELGRRNLRDRTAIVLVADHGEALGAHNHKTHATSLYDEQVRVPMLICLPGRAGKVFRRPVSTLDASATILALAGASLKGIDGVNLLPLIDGDRYPERRPVVTELHRYQSTEAIRTVDLQAIVLDHWKLIRDVLRDTLELYDLEADPGELRSVLHAEPETAEELEGMLDALVAGRVDPAPPRPLFSSRPAAFEVTGEGALLWARTTLPADVHFELATRKDFKDLRGTAPTRVTGDSDFTHVADVAGLTPGVRYFYRAVLTHAGEATRSDAGSFTAAAAAPKAIKIAWGADLMTDHQPYKILDLVRRQKPDLFVLAGDTMYADIPAKNAAVDLKGYRARHRAVRSDASLQALLAATATAAIWDDHEIVNNAHRDTPGLDLARQAFREQWPVRAADPAGVGLYRTLRPAPQVELFILDLRSFRDAPDEGGTMLGAEQKAWLAGALAASSAPLKVIVSSVPVFAPFGEDSWTAFPGARDDLRALLAAQPAGGVVVLSGDYHLAWHLVDDASGVHEFVAGPLAAWSFLQMQPNRLDAVTSTGRFAYTEGPNFGVLEVSPEGAATVRYFDGKGKERHSFALSGEPAPAPGG